MTPEEAGARLAALVGEPATSTVAFGQSHVDVPANRWVAAATLARDDAELRCAFFDWLSGVDELDGGFAVVTHLYSVEYRHHVLLRTRVPRLDPRLPSLTGVYAGAGWHERETFEMFGVVFDGHPDLKPLLLPDGFEGHPLRKDFVLAARVAKPWPGAKEPGESDHGAPSRRRIRPPGVPDPSEWGPGADPVSGGARVGTAGAPDTATGAGAGAEPVSGGAGARTAGAPDTAAGAGAGAEPAPGDVGDRTAGAPDNAAPDTAGEAGDA